MEARLSAQDILAAQSSAPAHAAIDMDASCTTAGAVNLFGPLSTVCTAPSFGVLLAPFDTGVISTCTAYESALTSLCPGIADCFALTNSAMLIYTFIAAGDIATFDVAQFTASFAAVANVPIASVHVTVGGASVQLTATLVLPSVTAASAVRTSLGEFLGDAQAASMSLGFDIAAVIPPSVVRVSADATVTLNSTGGDLLPGLTYSYDEMAAVEELSSVDGAIDNTHIAIFVGVLIVIVVSGCVATIVRARSDAMASARLLVGDGAGYPTYNAPTGDDRQPKHVLPTSAPNGFEPNVHGAAGMGQLTCHNGKSVEMFASI